MHEPAFSGLPALLSVLLFPLAGSLLLRGDVKQNRAPADIAAKQVVLVPKQET
jgi:hypothetical protein